MKRLSCALALLAAGSISASAQKESSMFPYVLPWDDASPTFTNISSWLAKPAGAEGFVTTKDGHLYAGGKRIRLFGVNLCFGANFPKKEDAEKVAARLAKFGFNCVRFHHMDMQSAPSGIFAADGRTLDPGQMEKLDYFIAQLAKHGIYSNINLHVSRRYPDAPKWEDETEFMKGVDLFYPPMLEMQKDYARQLLEHVNPYTGKRYADDPAVAIVEINNENGLIVTWWGHKLDKMPEEYTVALGKLWNDWLAKRYSSEDAWKSAWNEGSQSEGAEMLRNGDFSKGMEKWSLEELENARAAANFVEGSLKIDVTEPGKEPWHVQLAQSDLSLEKGKSYSLKFKGSADASRSIRVTLAQSGPPWKQYWSEKVQIGAKPKEVVCIASAGESDPKARLLFSELGSRKGSISLSEVSLRQAEATGASDTFGKVGLLTRSSYRQRTPAAQRDWMQFLWATEKDYWTAMQSFLKEEIKTRSLIVGTAVGFSPPLIQSELDVVDSHAYWQHPRFPGASWDPKNWEVNNISMAGVPSGGTLPGLALRRVAGKPYICTEYNASAPNTYSSEAFLLVSAYAALQDWDGLFVFAYSHRRDNWDSSRFGGFFDVDQHPAKMVTIPASAALFLRGDVAPAKSEVIETITESNAVEASMASGSWWGADHFGVPEVAAMISRTGIRLGSKAESAPKVDTEPPHRGDNSDSLVWNTAEQSVLVDTERSKAAIGRMKSARFRGGIEIVVGETEQEWAAITLTAMTPVEGKVEGNWLLTATGNTGNTGVNWAGNAKLVPGSGWGKAPSVVEGIPLELGIPNAQQAKVWVLDETGARRAEVPRVADSPSPKFRLGPEYRTLWYEVEIR